MVSASKIRNTNQNVAADPQVKPRGISRGGSNAMRAFRAVRMLRPDRAFQAMRNLVVQPTSLIASLQRKGQSNTNRTRGKKRAMARRLLKAAWHAVISFVKLPISYAFASRYPEGRALAPPGVCATLANAPANSMSRWVGHVAGAQRLPKWVHQQMIRTVIQLYKIDTSEIERPINEYPTVQAFFSRRLIANARIPHPTALLVSPCDAEVLGFGRVHDDNMIVQVKGNSYPLEELLQTHLPPPRNPSATQRWFYLFHLRPRDYHRFHAPCDAAVMECVHVPGTLHPVTDVALKWVPHLFAINERVTIVGEWLYGPIAMVPVGATCVGSIALGFDPSIKTNTVRTFSRVASLFRGSDLSSQENGVVSTATCVIPKTDLTTQHSLYAPHAPQKFDYRNRADPLPRLRRGEECGWFNWGSAIVIVADLPHGIEPCVTRFSDVRVGDALCAPVA